MLSRDRDFLKMLIASLSVISILALQGCSTVTTAPEAFELGGKLVERIPTDVGRFSAWTVVRASEEVTAQKELDAEIAKANADEARDRATTYVLNTSEKIYMYSMAKANDAIGKIALALANRDKKQLARTPMPEGVIGESFRAAGSFVKDVGNTPTAIVLSTALPFVSLGKAAVTASGDSVGGDKTTISGNENTVSAQRNPVTTTATTAGAESAATATP